MGLGLTYFAFSVQIEARVSLLGWRWRCITIHFITRISDFISLELRRKLEKLRLTTDPFHVRDSSCDPLSHDRYYSMMLLASLYYIIYIESSTVTGMSVHMLEKSTSELALEFSILI